MVPSVPPDMDPAELEPKPINRVALACIQCRSRHVKCDATQPVCLRCKRDGKECTYQKSRRGGLDKAALARRRLMLQQQAGEGAHMSGENTSHNSSPGSSNSGDRDMQIDRHASNMELDALRLLESDLASSQNMAFQISPDRLLDIFYENFWPAIPITLPLRFLNKRRSTKNHGVENLLLVLQWIGSIYAPWAPAEPYYEAANRALQSHTLPRNPWTVQALTLFSAAQYYYDLRPEGRRTADVAVALALELQMNQKGFAQAYGEGSPVLEESWRRTYFFLAILDQHLAVTVNSPIFVMLNVPNFVDLPCDDEYYESGEIPNPATWQDYDTREFDDVEVIYSSMVYMSDIARVVAFIMKTFATTGTFDDTIIAAVDSKVAAWQSLLPACKRDPLRPNGKVDEVMFQAHMMAAIIIMTAHRPFSALTYSIEELSTTSFASPVPFIEPLKQGRGTHTARALKAVDLQTKLLAIPCVIEQHHVFSISIIASLATAQISACNNLLEDHASSIARDRIRLSIGFLKAMGTTWPLARKMTKEVRQVARRTLAGLPSTVTQEADPEVEIDIPRDEMIWPVDPSAQIDIFAGITLPMNWDATVVNYSSSSTSSLS